MLEKFENDFTKMYPLEPETYWRVMRQHVFMLDEKATELVIDTSKFNFAPTKYNYYRYFLENSIEMIYWVPLLVLNRVESIYDLVDEDKPFMVLSDFSIVDEIISTVHE